ncbi:MAG: SIR2 family protein [Pseudomonadota bacterium]
MTEKAKPSFGHVALATLFEIKLTEIVWTTNFDRLVEDAAAKVFDTTSKLATADITDPERLRQAFSESRWPAYGKLHGDFQSEALKNTAQELQSQDASMRRLLVNACKARGLAVVGYSGRDASVMDALLDAIDGGLGFPGGLYWFVRSREAPYPAARRFVMAAREAGVEAAFVHVESFDELFSDLLHYLPQTASRAIALREETMPRRAKMTLPDRAARKPFIRTNAIPVTSYPKVCWLIDCGIGGWEEIQETVAQAGSNVLAARIRAGVIAFGDNAELKRLFGKFKIKNISTHGIVPERLDHETGERTLLRMALLRGIERFANISIERRGPRASIIAPANPPKAFGSLKQAAGQLTGVVANTSYKWSEACDLRLEYKLDGLWLMLDPTIRVETENDISEDDRNAIKEFVRERRARRFNKQANAILEGWTSVIFPNKAGTVLIASVDGKGGIGASFEIAPITAYSGLQP